jgi:hypothetical protein
VIVPVTYYQIPRDEDGTPSREFDHLFQRIVGWWPEIEIPEDMVSKSSQRKGEAPRHMGDIALGLLRDGNDISQRQLDAALDYLVRVIFFYENSPWEGTEPYPGRNEQAARDHQALLDELLSVNVS